MKENYPKTNLYVIDPDLWNWAKSQASKIGFKSVSEYVFNLIYTEKNSEIIRGNIFEAEPEKNLVIGELESSKRAGLYYLLEKHILRRYLGKRVKLSIFEIIKNDKDSIFEYLIKGAQIYQEPRWVFMGTIENELNMERSIVNKAIRELLMEKKVECHFDIRDGPFSSVRIIKNHNMKKLRSE